MIMAIRNIVTTEDPVLRKKSRPIEKFDERLFTLLDDMKETMVLANGVGLAAPGTEMFYAGRHEHNGSADPYDNGTNYTAPLKVVHLRSFKPLTYRYLLAVGDVETIAEKFRETLPDIDNRSLEQYGA